MNPDPVIYYFFKYGSVVLMAYTLLRIAFFWRSKEKNRFKNLDYFSVLALFFAAASGLWHFYGYLGYVWREISVKSVSSIQTHFEHNIGLMYEEIGLFIAAFLIALIGLKVSKSQSAD
jgi:hypothetical protein